MKISDLRSYLREKRVKGYSTMRKKELEKVVSELKKEEKIIGYERKLKENAICRACLTEQRIQRLIDEKTFDQRLYEGVRRELVCEFCEHTNLAYDSDDTFCVTCGALQPPLVK